MVQGGYGYEHHGSGHHAQQQQRPEYWGEADDYRQKKLTPETRGAHIVVEGDTPRGRGVCLTVGNELMEWCRKTYAQGDPEAHIPAGTWPSRQQATAKAGHLFREAGYNLRPTEVPRTPGCFKITKYEVGEVRKGEVFRNTEPERLGTRQLTYQQAEKEVSPEVLERAQQEDYEPDPERKPGETHSRLNKPIPFREMPAYQ